MVLNILLITIVTICLITDLKSRKIYNKVLLPALVMGVIINIYGNGWAGLFNSSLGFIFGLGLLLIPFMLGGIGGGDVKLLATIGSIKGPQFVLATFIGMGLAGGIIGLAILLYQRRLWHTLKSLTQIFWSKMITGYTVNSQGKGKDTYFPYGVAIAAGVLVAYGIG